MTSTAIAISSLVVRVRGRCLLDVESLDAEDGSVVAIMGPNGAGKTTLIRTCLGLARATSGDVVVLGENLRSLSSAGLTRLRRRVGYVPQMLPVRGELPLTVREVVAIGRTARAGLFHSLSRVDWEAADTWLERLGLISLARRAFSDISGGEQRKTIIARAMAQEPELLLLDEPTANLDLGWRERIVETIQELRAEIPITVIIVCHELEVLPPVCRRVVLLNAGRVATVGPPETVFTTSRVSLLYGATLRALHQNGRHSVVPGGGPYD